MSDAAAAAQKPAQWVMLPTKPFGQTAARRSPRGRGAAGTPSAASARRAAARPAANSSRRFVAALATATASSGKSSARYMAGSATQTTTPAGNSRAMSVACKLHAARLVTRLRQWTVASRIMKFTRVGETPRLAAMSFWLTPRKRCSSNA